jgi:uracil-DNA glycosylase
MEAQLAFQGFSVNTPVGAGDTPSKLSCAVSPSNSAQSGIEQDHAQMPRQWCEFAGLDPADFPTVPEPAFPPPASRFAAFHLTSPQDCRVVIVGQDPYHGPAQAQGLSFSVPMTLRAPPSLKNILKELASDLESTSLRRHDLTDWAGNGVLLLNAILSVAPGAPASHRQLGWQSVTSRILSALGNDTLGKDNAPRVFMLWGADAMSLRPQIDERKHLVLASSHPSPMGNACRRASGNAPAFFGSRPFSRANQWLQTRGREPIAWV